MSAYVTVFTNGVQGCNFISLCGCTCTHNPELCTHKADGAPTMFLRPPGLPASNQSFSFLLTICALLVT